MTSKASSSAAAAAASGAASSAASTAPVFDVDGSVLEGGGQILRNSFSYSALFNRPVRIFNIRAKRKNPGLAAQHLESIRLVKDVARGALEGAELKSTQVTLRPGKLEAGSFTADPGTAGSVTLMLQASTFPLLFTGGASTLDLRGGTDVAFSPPINFLYTVLFPTLQKMGIDVSLELKRRGFYPKGCGQILVHIKPLLQAIKPIEILHRGQLSAVHVLCYSAGQCSPNVGQEMAQLVKKTASQALGVSFGKGGAELNVETVHFERDAAFGSGSGINILLETDTGCVLHASAEGSPKERPADTVRDAFKWLEEQWAFGGCMDEHLQDQLIMPMSLAKGKSRILTGPLSLHTKTAIHIAEQFTPAKFTVHDPATPELLASLGVKVPPSKKPAQLVLIECEGMGLVPPGCKEEQGGAAAASGPK